MGTALRKIAPLKNNKQETAAQLLANDNLSDAKIAEQVGISARMLCYWKTKDYFKERVNAVGEEFAERFLKRGLAQRARRLASATADYEKAEEVVRQRSIDPTLANVPGGSTGMITRTGFDTLTIPVKRLRTIKTGGKEVTEEYTEIVKQSQPIYEADVGLFKYRQEVREEIARELGQLPNEQVQVAHGATDIKIAVVYITPDGKPLEAPMVQKLISGNGHAEVAAEVIEAEASKEFVVKYGE